MTNNSNDYHRQQKKDPNWTQKWPLLLNALRTTWAHLLGRREATESSLQGFTQACVPAGLSGSREAGPVLLAGGCVLSLPPLRTHCEILVTQLAPGFSPRKARHALFTRSRLTLQWCVWNAQQKNEYSWPLLIAVNDQLLTSVRLPLISPVIVFSLSSCCFFIVYLVMSSLAF